MSVQDVTDWRDREKYIRPLLPLISRDLLVEFLRPSFARTDDEADQARAIATMISQFPDEERVPLLERELLRVQTFPMRWKWKYTLEALAPHLPESLAERALQFVTHIEDTFSRVDCLGALAPCLHGKLLERAVESALQEKEGWGQCALASLVVRMEEPLLLAAWQALQREKISKELLLAMVPRLPEPLLSEALKDTFALDEPSRVEVFTLLIPRLSSQTALMQHILQSIPAYQNRNHQAHVFFLLASHIPESLLSHAFVMMSRLGYEEDRQQALHILRSRFTKQQQKQAVNQAMQEFKQQRSGVKGIMDAASLLYPAIVFLKDSVQEKKQGEQDQTATEQSTTAPTSGVTGSKSDFTAQPLSGAVLAQQWQAATEIAHSWERAHAFVQLLPSFIDQKLLLKEIYSAILAGLQPAPERSRKEILQKLSAQDLFQPPIFSHETLYTIASHIHTICRDDQ